MKESENTETSSTKHKQSKKAKVGGAVGATVGVAGGATGGALCGALIGAVLFPGAGAIAGVALGAINGSGVGIATAGSVGFLAGTKTGHAIDKRDQKKEHLRKEQALPEAPAADLGMQEASSSSSSEADAHTVNTDVQ